MTPLFSTSNSNGCAGGADQNGGTYSFPISPPPARPPDADPDDDDEDDDDGDSDDEDDDDEEDGPAAGTLSPCAEAEDDRLPDASISIGAAVDDGAAAAAGAVVRALGAGAANSLMRNAAAVQC